MVHWRCSAGSLERYSDSLQCASLLSRFVSGISEDICRSGLCHLGLVMSFGFMSFGVMCRSDTVGVYLQAGNTVPFQGGIVNLNLTGLKE